MITDYEEIIEKYLDDVYRICLYYTRNEQLAEFVTHKVFTKCCIQCDDIDTEHIFSIMVHEIKETLMDIVNKKYTGEELEQCMTNGEK